MASYHVEIKSGKKGSAKEHARYVIREGKHRDHRDDLLDTGYGNLPDWAANNPNTFWVAADKYERANGAAYREFVIAMPNEFSLNQSKQFMEKAVAALIGNKPYQYAIHAPNAALGETSNTHTHLMFSDRQPDGIPRSPEQTFARYNAKQPERGGCRKGSGGRNRMQLRDDVIAKRKIVADIQNEMLAEYGSTARVDHRSYRQRGIERKPERHLGPARINGMSAEEKVWHISMRECAALAGLPMIGNSAA